MFNGISWYSYWVTIALLSAGYYLTIYLLYFRSDFVFGHRRKEDVGISASSELLQKEEPASVTQPSLFDDLAPEFQRPPTDSEEEIVYACMDELTAFFEAVKRTQWHKDALHFTLRKILNKYPSLERSSYKESFQKVLTTQCAHHCSIHLDKEDLVRLWHPE